MADHSLKRLRINLASVPLRNRNLYFTLLGLLAVLILAAAVGGGLIYFRYHGRNVASRASLQDLELSSESARTETASFAAKSQEASRRQKARVDFANEAVYFKSFSWTGFLSEMERSLPGASHIIALTPTPMGKSRVEVRLRVVSASLNEMLAFVNNLKAPSFANIRIISDEQKGGEIVSEVSLTYEEHR
jgi:hypothetical protein